MKIEFFSRNSKKDVKNAEILFSLREMDEKVENLPESGFIVYNADQSPIAMGFLRLIEGNYGMLDSYISNPQKPSELRDQALDLITKNLINYSKTLGLNKLFAFSANEHIILRAYNHGFGRLPFKFTCLNLSKDDVCHS